MKCKCGNEWVYQKHSWPAQGDMLYCVTCNVGWDAEDVISELEAENKRLREAIREALNSNYLASQMGKEPDATASYGINARLLWAMKEALEENNDES